MSKFDTEKKEKFYLNSVCKFCKYDKLSKDEILEIETKYYFLDVCLGCKKKYEISKYI